MIDWIAVLLEQPGEEADGDSLDELNRAEAAVPGSRENGRAAAGARREQPENEARPGGPAEPEDTFRTEAEPQVRYGPAEAAAGQAGAERTLERGLTADGAAETLAEALRQGAAAGAARSGTESEPGQDVSAGRRAAAAAEAARLQPSGGTAPAAVNAGRQAERAAERAGRREQGGSAHLEAALAAPAVPAGTAGRLLAAMVRNDRAAAYQTTARQAAREENDAWTGTDPVRLDRTFERDARRYDNGFSLY